MSDPQARTLADRLEHFYLLTGDEGQALLVEVMAALRSVPVVPDNASELRASGATSSGSDEETIERVCTAIAAIGSNLTAWNLRRIAVAAIEAVAPNGRGVANEREARLLAAAENLQTPFDREYMKAHLLARSIADVPPEKPQPDHAALIAELRRAARGLDGTSSLYAQAADALEAAEQVLGPIRLGAKEAAAGLGTIYSAEELQRRFKAADALEGKTHHA